MSSLLNFVITTGICPLILAGYPLGSVGHYGEVLKTPLFEVRSTYRGKLCPDVAGFNVGRCAKGFERVVVTFEYHSHLDNSVAWWYD